VKGQFNIVAVIGVLITLIMLGATMPIIMQSSSVMGDNLTANGFGTAGLVSYLIPVILLLIVVMGFFRQGQAVQPQ